MPREIITTAYSESEFKEVLKSIVEEVVKHEIERILNRPINPCPTKEFLNRQETCKLLGISLPTLDVRIRKVFYLHAELEEKFFSNGRYSKSNENL